MGSTLSKSLAQVMVGEVHPEEKSVFAFKPNTLEVVRPQRPPYQAAGLVNNPRYETLAPHNLVRGGSWR